MSEPVRIDSHVHIYQSVEEGIAAKEGYEIWEYGRQEEVAISDVPGTVDDLLRSMEKSSMDKVVIVNLYVADEQRLILRKALPPNMGQSERERAEREIEARVREELMAFNRWACDVAKDRPSIFPFVCADVLLFTGEENAAHVRDLAENQGARGVKLHGPAEGFFMGDERLWPTYTVCRELGLPVIGHSGPDRGGNGFAEPRAFGAVLKAFPELPIVLAHMGGATWQQALEIAESYDNAYFDCCEVIEWTRSENGPSERELARLIQDIGTDRVMMGSDFPWYDLDQTVDRVMSLPLLSMEEKEGIIGANAERILRI